jgi:hypothetical protein
MADSEFQQLSKTDRNPIQETRYQELLKSGAGGGSDIASSAAQLLKMYQEANKPAVESLQASIPEIQNKYAQTGQYLQKQVGTLDERYKNLLSSITGARDTSVQNVETNTSQELGRRGISAQSGLFGQTVNKATQPVQQAFAGDISNLGVSQQSALDTLMNMISGNTQSSVESQRSVQNAIAQLQAGAGQSSVTGALQQYQAQQAATEAQKQRDLQLQIAQMGQGGSSNQDRYITIGDGAMLLDTSTGQIIENKKSFAGSSGGDSGW